MFAPSFLTTAISEASRRSAFGPSEPAWKVSLAHSFYSDRTVNLWFPTESEARQFSPWQIYTPAQVLDKAGNITSPFEVKAIERASQKTVNPVTELVSYEQSWKASLENVDGRAADWHYQTEIEVRGRFGGKRDYTVLDMFGTVQSVPQPVAASYEFAAEQAAEKAQEAEAALHKQLEAKAALYQSKQTTAAGALTAAQAKQMVAQGLLTKEQAEAQVAEAKAAAAPRTTQEQILAYSKLLSAAETERLQADQAQRDLDAANQALAVANANLAQAKISVQQAQFTVARRTIPEGQNEYTITHGGAAGLYNGVYYKSGTFHAGPDFQWQGIYQAK